MPLMLHGIGVPSGIAIGRVYRGRDPVHAVAERAAQPGAETARYRKALALAQRRLRAVRAAVPRAAAAAVRPFIDSHIQMLRDGAFTDAVVAVIRDRHCNAEWALILQRDALLAAFDRIEDPYLRARRDEVEHVVERLLAALAGVDDGGGYAGDGAIHVAATLGPTDVLRLQQNGAGGFITESGGPHSHAAIIARSLRMPGVLGVRDARALIRADDEVVLDGDTGFVVVAPDERTIAHYQARRRETERRRAALRGLRDRPAVTRDGVAVGLLANIERPADVRAARAGGADGVGMYRTELLFLDRPTSPDEGEQYAAYAKVVSGMRGGEVTIRTLDTVPPGASENPSLGLRAIRADLQEPSRLETQLRALLRAAALGPVSVMVPMVTSVSEIVRVRRIVERIAAELDAPTRIPIGAMIETPAAALTAAALARECDFLALGTNDLVQYTLAVDRDNDEVDHLYDPLHPAVLKLIAQTAAAARRAGRPLTACGEIAGDARYTRLLLGLGLRRLSMHPAHLLEVKDAVNSTDAAAARRGTARIIAARDATRARELLDELNSP